MSKTDSAHTERRILAAMRKVLTRIIRETASPQGTRHPLSNTCLEDMRQCLILIDSRQRELSEDDDNARPRYKGDRPAAQSAEVPLTDLLKRRNN